jgi:hypothetical protein
MEGTPVPARDCSSAVVEERRGGESSASRPLPDCIPPCATGPRPSSAWPSKESTRRALVAAVGERAVLPLSQLHCHRYVARAFRSTARSDGVGLLTLISGEVGLLWPACCRWDTV